jgi:hypothetical protein
MELIFDTRAKATKGAFLHLTHPGTGVFLYEKNEDGTANIDKPVGLYLIGQDSTEYEQYKYQKQNKARAALKPQPVTAESVDNDARELMAAMTTGWENVSVNGNTTFSKATVLELYRAEPWAYEQASMFFVDRANFL